MTANRHEDEDQRMHEPDPAGATAETAVTERRPFRPTWMLGTVAVLFGLFYAYDVWEAVDRWLQYAGAYAQIEQQIPWGLYLAAVLAPFAVFLAVMIAGRKRSIGSLAIMLAVGLGVSAVLALSLQYAAESLFLPLYSALLGA